MSRSRSAPWEDSYESRGPDLAQPARRGHAIEWANGAPRVGINEMSQPYQPGAASPVRRRVEQAEGDE
jgi:hypothetical protein